MQALMEMAIHEKNQSEEISTREALRAPDREKFIAAIKSEIRRLFTTTQTLVSISREEVDRIVDHITIGTKAKYMRKKKGIREPDTHKAMSAARGDDELTREYERRGIILPPTFSSTVSPLTFALVLQLAIILGLIIATADIKLAYLLTQFSLTAISLITWLDKSVVKICGKDPMQLSRINKYIYGLPDSGRAFYYKYKAALEKEEYRCSKVIRRDSDDDIISHS